ncbi:zinc finger domain-containing protein, partial [Serratia ureilytica]
TSLLGGGGLFLKTHWAPTGATPIESAKHGQRSTFFCRRCQR